MSKLEGEGGKSGKGSGFSGNEISGPSDRETSEIHSNSSSEIPSQGQKSEVNADGEIQNFKKALDGEIKPALKKDPEQVDSDSTVSENLEEFEAAVSGEKPAEKTTSDIALGKELKEFEKAMRGETGTDGKKTLEGVKANKDRENVQLTEGLSPKELEEVKQKVASSYENGEVIAKKGDIFSTYKEHHILEYEKTDDGKKELHTGHIENVRERSLEAASCLEKSLEQNDYKGKYSPEIDRKTLEVAALYHDTGMDGNLKPEEYEAAKQEYIESLTDKEKAGKTDQDLAERFIRGDHSVQSAIHVLKDSEEMNRLGVDKNEVAFLCMLHSKSNSGIENLADDRQWSAAVEKLQQRVKEYNEHHPNETISFDDSFLRDEKGKPDSEKIARVRSEALCLRLGDANGHDYRSRVSQNGKNIEFDLSDFHLEEHSEDTGQDDEIKNARVEVNGKKLVSNLDEDAEHELEDKSGMGRMFALGEGNFKSLYTSVERGPDNTVQTVENIELVDADAYPYCTQECILERIKEINTARIEADNDQTDPSLDEKVAIPVCIHLGCVNNEKTIQSYEQFQARIKTTYNIEVKLDYES